MYPEHCHREARLTEVVAGIAAGGLELGAPEPPREQRQALVGCRGADAATILWGAFIRFRYLTSYLADGAQEFRRSDRL